MVAIDPMRGMISSYISSPQGQEMIRNYLSSPEGQKAICEYIATPQGRQTIKQILPGMLACLNLSPDVTELIVQKIREMP